jgi:hypothetical protein
LVYLLNFSTIFNTTESFNSTTAFTTISKAPNGGSANNIGPQYYDGSMFANDYEWVTYGGLLLLSDSYKPPASNAYTTYQAYEQGSKTNTIGFQLGQLPTEMTRYITNGAGTSVPSENLGFYFGGLESTSGGPIYQGVGPANISLLANVETNTLITVDLSTEGNEGWTNDTLPTSVPGRANAEIVWVPVSKRGVLVAIGGVINPTFATLYQKDNATQTAESVSTHWTLEDLRIY